MRMRWALPGLIVLVAVGAFFLWPRPTYWASATLSKGAVMYDHGASPQEAIDNLNASIGSYLSLPQGRDRRVVRRAHLVSAESLPPAVRRSAP
jgi:hypothetical protein